MPRVRYTIRHGDKTTAGGVVDASGNPPVFIHGAIAAVEGNPVHCPACGQTGRLILVGSRLDFFLLGKKIALSGDECACGCSPAPRLLASQSVHCQSAEGGDAPARKAFARSYHGDQPSTFASRTVRLTDSFTGELLRHHPCVVTVDGKTVRMATDANGCMALSHPREAQVFVHAVFVAPMGALHPVEGF